MTDWETIGTPSSRLGEATKQARLARRDVDDEELQSLLKECQSALERVRGQLEGCHGE